MKKYTVHIVWLVVAVVAFVGGMYYGKAAAPAGGAGLFGASSTRGGLAGRTGAGGGFTAGTIMSMDSQSMTIQLPNGNSQIVFYSSSTSVSEPQPVAPSALKTGTMVTVGDTANADGSLSAQTIQVRPAGSTGPGGFGGGAGRGGAASGTN